MISYHIISIINLLISQIVRPTFISLRLAAWLFVEPFRNNFLLHCETLELGLPPVVRRRFDSKDDYVLSLRHLKKSSFQMPGRRNEVVHSGKTSIQTSNALCLLAQCSFEIPNKWITSTFGQWTTTLFRKGCVSPAPEPSVYDCHFQLLPTRRCLDPHRNTSI